MAMTWGLKLSLYVGKLQTSECEPVARMGSDICKPAGRRIILVFFKGQGMTSFAISLLIEFLLVRI